ncbi:caspase family protein ASCRUDRAFT_21414, partial [Ascoidea rubescens DSM 1968]
PSPPAPYGYGSYGDSSYGSSQKHSQYSTSSNSYSYSSTTHSYSKNNGKPVTYKTESYSNSAYGGNNRPSYNSNQYDNRSRIGNSSNYNRNNDDDDDNYDFEEATDAHVPTRDVQNFDSRVKNYHYKYSDCSGKKKALLIGINYIGTSAKLNGCINDVKNVKAFLLKNGYSEDDMVILTDDQTNSRAIPTKQNMLDAMGWLVSGASPNDSLFFHFSGHGSQQEDKDGDEDDGFDETIVPLDYEKNGQIVDELIHDTIVKPLPEGCRLTALFDCCHSGSALDLPYTYSTKGLLKEPNILQEAGQGLFTAFQSYMAGDAESAVKSVFGTIQNVMSLKANEGASEKTKKTRTSPADVIMLSGCKDDQTSADASIGGEATGAMSYAFMKVMNTGKKQSYLSLLKNTRQILEGKYSQKPQLSASHPIDVSLQFI